MLSLGQRFGVLAYRCGDACPQSHSDVQNLGWHGGQVNTLPAPEGRT